MNLLDSLAEITHLFEHEISLSTTLLVVLKNEQHALSKNNIDVFEAAIIEKDKLIIEIESTEKKIVHVLKKNGLTMEKQDINKLMARCNPVEKESLTQLLDKLKEMATQCRDQNLVNGKIVTSSHENVQKIIGVLRGQPTEQSNVYDLSGKSSGTIKPQTLGRV